MTATLDHPAPSPGRGDPRASGRPPRRAGGAVLVVLGLVVAGLLVVTAALTLVGVLVRQEATTRQTFSGVDAAALELGCSGDVSVVADPALAPGTAEVTWREHWSTSRPRHGAAVVDGRLALSSACSSLSLGSPRGSDVAVRLPEGAVLTVDAELGDVTTRGVTGDLTVTTDVGDVDVRDADGDVTVRTDLGDVALAGRVGSAEVEVDTGDVRVRSSTVPDGVRVEGGLSDVVVTVPAAGSYDVSAGTGLGVTAVTVDDEPGATRRIAVSVGFGDVTVRPGG